MDFLHTIKLLVEENDAAIDSTQQAIMRVDFLLSRAFQKDFTPSESISQELSLLFQERRFLQGREESQRRERLILIQSLCATGASQQMHMHTYQTALQPKILAPPAAPPAASYPSSQALVSQHQLMTSFDHLNPHAVLQRAQISEVESVGNGMSAMKFQETQRFHGFSSQQNDYPNGVCELGGSFSARPRPEHLEFSSLASNSPSQWNVQSPLQSGDSSYVPTTSRQMYIHNEEAREARRVLVDSSGDHALISPSGALSPDRCQHMTPPTCSKVLLPEFSQEASSKKLFLDVTKANLPKDVIVNAPGPTVTTPTKKCSVRMKCGDGHWREWTDTLQDVKELLDLLKSNKLWNRRFACSAIWSLARPGIVARDLIRDLNGIPLLVSLIDAPSSDDELKRLAAGCIWSICKQSPSNCDIVLECGGVDSICTLLEHGNDEQKCEAIGALRNLGGVSTTIAQRIVQCQGLKMLKECMRQERNSKIREWSARAIKEIMWP